MSKANNHSSKLTLKRLSGVTVLAIVALCFNACIEVLESDYTVDAPILVVQASVLDTLIEGISEQAPMQVNLYSVVPTSSTYVQGGLEDFGVVDAAVSITDTDNNNHVLTHQGAGLYTNMTNGRAGLGYQLHITLADGKEISSDLEYLEQSPLSIDSLSVVTNGAANNTTAEVEVLMHLKNPNNDAAHYIYKSRKEYEFREDPVLPFPKICFISEAIDIRNVAIREVRTDELSPTKSVSTVDYDSRFAFKLFFHVYQYHISEETHNYYTQVEQNKNQSAALFAPIPGKITTNLSIAGDDSPDLQGYFTVASVEYDRTRSSSLSLEQSVIFACPVNSSQPWSSNALREFCGECLEHPNSTTDRPSYW